MHVDSNTVDRMVRLSECHLRKWLANLAAVDSDGCPSPFDSPIEFMLGTAIGVWSKPWFHHGQFHFIRDRGYTEAEGKAYVLGSAGACEVALFPQATVGKYRVDMLVVYEGGGIAIECDGHEFHERTKEQATSDKARDRHLQLRGYKVLRFTGSEIWADPFASAMEVLRTIASSVKPRGPEVSQ